MRPQVCNEKVLILLYRSCTLTSSSSWCLWAGLIHWWRCLLDASGWVLYTDDVVFLMPLGGSYTLMSLSSWCLWAGLIHWWHCLLDADVQFLHTDSIVFLETVEGRKACGEEAKHFFYLLSAFHLEIIENASAERYSCVLALASVFRCPMAFMLIFLCMIRTYWSDVETVNDVSNRVASQKTDRCT